MAIINQLSAIGDAIREKTGSSELLKLNDMPNAIRGIQSGEQPTETIDIDSEGVHNVLNYANANVNIDLYKHVEKKHNLDPADWIRPVEWQPMATGYETGEQLYMVYDTELLPSNATQFACWYATTSSSSTSIKVERGYVDTDGNYQTVSQTTFNRSTTFIEDLPNIGQRYLVYKITPNGSGHITGFYHDRPTVAYHPYITGSDMYSRICQPMIEAYGSLPYVTTMYSNGYRTWNAFYEVHHDIRNMTALTSCANMFLYGEKLECIDGLDTWNTSNVTSFSSFMSGCRTLEYVKLNNIVITAKCTNMYAMFQNCYLLAEININIIDSSNVTNFGAMFYQCFNLDSFDFSKLISAKVARIDTMFYGCYKIREIDLSGLSVGTWTTSQTLASMFANCYNVQKIDISNLAPASNTSIANMFQNCCSLREIKMSPNFTTDNVTSMASVFQYCYLLENVDFIENWNSSKVTTFSNMFRDCRRLKSINLSNFSTAVTTTVEAMFQNCYMLETLDLPDNFITSKIITLNSTFSNCLKISRINTTGWDTQNVTTMASLFSGCRKLVDYGDVSNWNYNKCTTMTSMFANCNSITYLPDFSNKEFPAITTWASIFSYCSNVKGDIVMNNVSLPKATTLANAFQGLFEIDSLTTNNWNVPLVTTVTYIFSYLYKCHTLEAIGWTAPKISTWTYIFYYNYSLKNVNCDLVFTGTSSSNAFNYCYGLENVTAFPTIGKVATTLSYSTLVTPESWVKIFEALPTNSSALKLTIGTANIDKLTDEQKAIATNKKWTLA